MSRRPLPLVDFPDMPLLEPFPALPPLDFPDMPPLEPSHLDPLAAPGPAQLAAILEGRRADRRSAELRHGDLTPCHSSKVSELLTHSVAASVAGYSERHFRRLVQAGNVPHVWVRSPRGGIRLFERAAVERLAKPLPPFLGSPLDLELAR